MDEKKDVAVGDPMIRSDGRWRIQNKYLGLTYKTHLPKDAMKAYIQSKWPNNPIEVFEAAHENGKDDPVTPYEHTHIGVKFSGKGVQSENCRILDVQLESGEILHPNFVTPNIKNKKSWEKWLNYLSKEDPACAHLKKEEKGALANAVWACQSIQDVMLMCNDPGKVQGLCTMFSLKPDEELKDLEGWRPWGWQKNALQYLFRSPDPRQLAWLWEEKGGMGKTQFCRWLMYKWPQYFLILQGISYVRDTVQVIDNARKAGWNGFAIIVNLTRKFENKDFIYETLETLKDGIHTTQKYNGHTFVTPVPHVMILSNYQVKWVGDDGKPLMSYDRWYQWKIDNGGEVDPNKYVVPERRLPEGMGEFIN